MEDKDLQYVLVTADSARDLSERVTVFIGKGWVPVGSPFLLKEEGFAQAVMSGEAL
jgi:hypothetical protein